MDMRLWSRIGFFLIAGAVVPALPSQPARALGPAAPPRITFAAVWVERFSSNAFVSIDEDMPQLYVSVNVEIPGGDVPTNVSQVTVTLPDGVTTFDIQKAQDDLFVDLSYFRNLTQDGFAGFPTGTYTFSVTDTAGGVATRTDALVAAPVLPPTSTVSVSGAVRISTAPREQFSLDLAAYPTPTVTWDPVPGAALHRLRVRPYSGPDVYVHSGTSAHTSSTLPAGVMVPGRLYRFRVEAETSASGLPTTEARSNREIRVTTRGPELTMSSSGGTGTGQTWTVSARVINTGSPVRVNVHGWLGLPDGTVDTLFSLQGFTIATSTDRPDNTIFSGPVFTRTFTGADLSGNYVVGIRLSDPATGETVAAQSFRFGR